MNKTLLIAFGFISFSLTAQLPQDSLQIEEAFEYTSHSQNFLTSDSLIELGKHITSVSLELDYQRGIGIGYFMQGAAEMQSSNYENAVNLYHKALSYFNIARANEEQAKTKNNIGIIYRRLGAYSLALNELYEALDIIGTSDDDNKNNVYLNIANILSIQREFDQAEEIYNKALKSFILHRNYYGQGVVYGNLAAIEFERRDFKKAIQYQKQSLKILEDKTYSKLEIADAYNKLASFYIGIHDYEKAKPFLYKSLSQYEEIGSSSGMAKAMNNMATIKLMEGNLNGATTDAQKALSFAQASGEPSRISYSLEVLYRIKEKNGQYDSALFYHRKFAHMKDTIMTQEKAAELNRLHTLYQLRSANQHENQTESPRGNISLLTYVFAVLFIFIASLMVIILIALKIIDPVPWVADLLSFISSLSLLLLGVLGIFELYLYNSLDNIVLQLAALFALLFISFLFWKGVRRFIKN
jgi:tetratricopeptide (TPR) repeat protein